MGGISSGLWPLNFAKLANQRTPGKTGIGVKSFLTPFVVKSYSEN